MGWIWMIITGFFVGLVARALKPGNDRMGWISTTLLGIAGALLGAALGQALGIYRVGEPAGFFGAIIGALILLFIAQVFRRKSIA
jgi:uncharacterized membrane protein YeaQ/YmgE (transglycosylase-associated protein family)